MAFNINELNPIYRFLPYCAKITEENHKVVGVEYVKTYPAYPWIPGGDHRDDDPVEFINWCANKGLVRWETAEERRQREENEKWNIQ